MDKEDPPNRLDYRSAIDDCKPIQEIAKRIVAIAASLMFGGLSVVLWINHFSGGRDYSGAAAVATIGSLICLLIGLWRRS